MKKKQQKKKKRKREGEMWIEKRGMKQIMWMWQRKGNGIEVTVTQ